MQIVDDSGVPWHTWGLDDGLTRRLRDCAMAFHRWAPWDEIGDSVILRAKRVGGRSWAVAPMGDHEGSSIRGVALFAFAPPSAAAIAALDALADKPAAYARRVREMVGTMQDLVRGPALAVLFRPPDRLSHAARREIEEHGWQAAEDGTHPQLAAALPDEEMSPSIAEDLIAALGALMAFSSSLQDDSARSCALWTWHERVEWTDASNGTMLEICGPRPKWFLRASPDGKPLGLAHLAYIGSLAMAAEGSPFARETTTAFTVLNQLEGWARYGGSYPHDGGLDVALDELGAGNPLLPSLRAMTDVIAIERGESCDVAAPALFEYGRVREAAGQYVFAADAYETVLRLAGDEFDRSSVVQALGRCAICLALTGDRMTAMHAATVAEAVAKLSKRKVAKAGRWRR